MKYYLKYYKIVAGAYVLDSELQVYLQNAHARRSAEPKNNTGDISLANPIVDFFPDGTPRRQFVDSNGDNIFKASAKLPGFDSFEEKVELFAKDVDNIDEDIAVDSNLIFAGQIKDIEMVHEDKKVNIKINISDRTFNIMNRIWSNSYENLTYAEIMKNIVQQVTEDNSSLNRGGYDTLGVANNGPYLVDIRLFTEGIKGTDTITVGSKTIILDTGFANIEEGDLIKNNNNYAVALVRGVSGNTITVSKDIFSDGDSVSISDGFVQDWRPDGTVFPDLSFGKSKKPVIEWIGDLVQIENTNTPSEILATGVKIVRRPLKYYVDGQNRFHCFYPDDTPAVEIKMGATTPQGDDSNRYATYKCKMKKGIFDILNYIIFNCGEDMDDKAYTWYAQDPSSGGPNIKDCYRPFPKISENMKLQEYLSGNITYVGGTTFNYPVSYGATDTYIPAWSTTRIAVNSDSEYNEEFRFEGKRRGTIYAMRLINQSANPRWKGSIETGFYNFNPSDLIRFTDTDLGIQSELVRIKEVQHNLTKKGFFTTLTVEEDLPKIQ